jgi:hypothetical protein
MIFSHTWVNKHLHTCEVYQIRCLLASCGNYYLLYQIIKWFQYGGGFLVYYWLWSSQFTTTAATYTTNLVQTTGKHPAKLSTNE